MNNKNNQQKKNKMIVINDSSHYKVVNHLIVDKEVIRRSEILDHITVLNKELPSSSIPLVIDKIIDKDDNIIHTYHKQVSVSEQFCFLYKHTRNIICNKNNKLTAIDIYLFLYLCDNFANQKEFFVNPSFWRDINQDMVILDLNYTKPSLLNSLSKLTKTEIILKISKACFSINKIFIFSGQLDQRHKQIQEQYLNTIL